MRRASSSSSSSGQDVVPTPVPTNVQVAVRCRPLNAREKAAGRGAIVQCKPNANEVAVVKRKTYHFDRVFGQYSTQKDVFQAVVRPAVDEALAGYNCTVFAYGQTGTGKTYTMQGNLTPDHEMAGVIPRSIRCIFDALEASGEEFSVRVSFLQLYNEELKDLLDPNEDKKLRLMEDAKRGGVYCQNLLEVTATTAKHVYDLVNTGVKNRITSETLMNENSSRSHSIFTIRIHSKEHSPAGEDLLRVGQLNLVDLAGSECVGRSGARNARAREAGTINQSLLTLGRVITALVDNLPHVPYRDSKLTRLLQESLGGRAKTTIIATLAPCADSVDETLSTLEYAFRAKNIKNKPELNQKMTKAGLLNDFGSEIESLRAALRAARQKDGVYLPLEQFTEMQERLAGQGVQLTELEDMLKTRNNSCKELEETIEKHAIETTGLKLAKQVVDDRLTVTEGELATTKMTLEKTAQELTSARTALSAFQANEQVLLANGATAAKLYNASEKRAAQLLTKIEQKRQLEEINTELATSYRGQSQSQINVFLQRLEKHKERQENMLQDVSSAMHELQVAHSMDVEGLVTSLTALQGLVEARRNQTEEELAKDEAIKREQRGEVTASVTKQQEAMQEQLEKFVEMSKSHATAIADELAASKVQSMSFVEQVQSMLEGSREELGSFLTEQSDKLLELQVAIDMSIEQQAKQLKENKAVLVAALKDSHAQQQQELTGMKTQLAQFVDKCMQHQTEKLDEQTMLIEESAKDQHKQLEHVQTITEQEMKGFVHALSQQNSKHESETAELRERLSSMRGQVEETSSRQIALIQSQTTAHTSWSSAAAALEKTHAAHVTTLAEQHAEADAETSVKRLEQAKQFLGEHEELRELLNSGCKTLETGLQSHLSETKVKMEATSTQAGEVVAEATEQSTQRLQELETYMKKRRVETRTGSTPMKKDDRAFPVFEATKVVDRRMEAVEDSSSTLNFVSSESTGGRKRRRLSDASSSSIDNAASAVGDAVVEPQTTDVPMDATEETVVAVATSSSSQDSAKPSSAAVAEAVPASSIPVESKAQPASASRSVASKSRKLIPTASLKKKLNTGNTHKSTKVASAGGVRQTTKLSALAAPKRYRAKSPLGESTNFR
ncbi:hypothetical protein BBJ28_00000621 [Nothophytophthora sp. Chile5]|nr:hypothetical protein BBJ28_00000621 [Nothophytophthora sp. Chile5]